MFSCYVSNRIQIHFRQQTNKNLLQFTQIILIVLRKKLVPYFLNPFLAKLLEMKKNSNRTTYNFTKKYI